MEKPEIEKILTAMVERVRSENTNGGGEVDYPAFAGALLGIIEMFGLIGFERVIELNGENCYKKIY